MRAKCLGINCIIVKTIDHLNTVCLNIKRFSTLSRNIGINVQFISGIFCACTIQYAPNNVLLYFIKTRVHSGHANDAIPLNY